VTAKRPGREAGHSFPFSAEVRNTWSNTSTYRYCLPGMQRDNFTLLVSVFVELLLWFCFAMQVFNFILILCLLCDTMLLNLGAEENAALVGEQSQQNCVAPTD
jgi:hypothetical protein